MAKLTRSNAKAALIEVAFLGRSGQEKTKGR